MKKNLIIVIAALLLLTIACKETFFETPPLGQATSSSFYTKTGIDQLLIGTYSLLDGVGASSYGGRGPDIFGPGVSNWIWGEVSADDAYLVGYPDGSGFMYERHAVTPNDGNLDNKWIALYEGILRANNTMLAIANTKDLDAAVKTNFTAQTRFLRAFYYFELRKIFGKVPYIDETNMGTRPANTAEIWPNIEADLMFAAENLPVSQPAVGRINKWGAKALLAKAYLYQSKYAEAKTLFTDIITNGVTADGIKYGLNPCFRDNFDGATKNSKESVFAVQMSVNDGSPESDNGNFGDVLTKPSFNDAGVCCTYLKPSQNLANSFKTDLKGLPLLDTFNDSDLKNDDQLTANDPFTPDVTTPIDPRLGWTAASRGLPFLDWGLAPAIEEWAGGGGNYGGPYWPVKSMFKKSEKGKYTASNSWTNGITAANYNAIRFADVLLMAAEAEVEAGSLETARNYVNQIRLRAKTGCYLTKLDANGNPTLIPAQNYQVGEYTTAFTDKETARKAVRFERRLELAMEGHRLFDLIRWNIADQILNTYIAAEGKKRPLLASGKFVKGKHEYFPIPQVEITNSSVDGKPTLTQNPNY